MIYNKVPTMLVSLLNVINMIDSYLLRGSVGRPKITRPRPILVLVLVPGFSSKIFRGRARTKTVPELNRNNIFCSNPYNLNAHGVSSRRKPYVACYFS